MLAPRLGSASQFSRLRELLRRNRYDEAGIFERFQVSALPDLKTIQEGRQTLLAIEDGLDALFRLFLDGEYVPLRLLDEKAGSGTAELLGELQLIHDEGAPAGHCAATVMLYPVAGLWVASDRDSNPDHSRFTPGEDAVYPAATRNTLHFLAGLPAEPCESFLDLCAGTGIAALIAAANYCRHAWAFDIAPRCVHFSAFNARLNGLDNVTCAAGDLFEPAGDLQFDRIVAHPPYVPAQSTQLIYRDGGEDGEQVTRGIIRGLPRHLKRGGVFYCEALGSDRRGAAWESRVRQWLGADQAEFDVAVVARTIAAPSEFAVYNSLKPGADPATVRRWMETFARLGVEALFQGFILVQRHARPRPAFTVRRRFGAGHPRHLLNWLLRWESASAEPAFAAELLHRRLRLPSGLRLSVEHRVQDGELVPAAFRLRTATPFQTECEGESWIAVLASRCDGVRTVREHAAYLKEGGLIPDVAEEQFAVALRPLISGGLLEVEGFSLPQAAE